MSCISYPGIKSIGYIFADQVPANTIYNAVAGVPIQLFLKPTPIPLAAGAECVIESNNESNGIAETLTLTFSTALQLPRYRPLAFVITDVNGNTFLVGQPERPHLSVIGSRQTGTPEGESAVITYEIKQTAPICFKPCKMML